LYIDDSAFCDCRSLSSISIPSAIQAILPRFERRVKLIRTDIGIGCVVQ
jgi:hypothetical protein